MRKLELVKQIITESFPDSPRRVNDSRLIGRLMKNTKDSLEWIAGLQGKSGPAR